MEKPYDWNRLDTGKFEHESDAIAALLARNPLTEEARSAIGSQAVLLVQRARKSERRQGVVEGFLQEFALGTQEGLALMCLAEALLRIPDRETRDRLIAEKIGSADWASHLGHSGSVFVNASTWGLMMTGKLVRIEKEAEKDVPGFVRKLAGRMGEPVIRRAMATAVRIMGEQFVLGRTIESALERANREGLTCSFDMLGEGARTPEDAARFAAIYANAIGDVGRASQGAGPESGHGVSVKLSALSPRYEAVQEQRVWAELYPRLLTLAELAARHDLNLTIDAEEADRLVISLKLLDRLAHEPSLAGWTGLGLAVQAYQKRGLAVIEQLEALAIRSGRRLMVRLVKGAYWDSEVKAAQVAGMPDYPVFTTKPGTDLSYLICADALIAASPHLYAQFATHNAHTLAAVRHMAGERDVKVEYQRLHGMGEALYDAARELHGDSAVRTYAPVGGHEELLPYLVRRLLENGANSSFVHLLLDDDVPPDVVTADPVTKVLAQPSRHPAIPRPSEIYGSNRSNPVGRDWSQVAVRDASVQSIAEVAARDWKAGPIVGGSMRDGAEQPVGNPADANHDIGTVIAASTAHIDEAVSLARAAQPAWDRSGGAVRAAVLRRMADALDAHRETLMALATLEGGKTGPDAVAEVREAIDFCRYYAVLAERQFEGMKTLSGPAGERNYYRMSGRGVFACISPWNFPLAIFTGQIAAALAAGNAAIAKPAEQTPLIAAEAVRLFHGAGLSPDLLHLLPGEGSVIGAALVAHPGIDGVAFTGGTDTAWAINRGLAARDGPIVPFIAETGGLNAMFVDTTALREQVIDDAILSAFGSAGQRCSALRMLFVPRESAESLIAGLAGALETRIVGNPALPQTDIGPAIDEAALAALQAHADRLASEGRIVARCMPDSAKGHFFAPIIAEVEQPDFLEQEVFGPILHVCRYGPGQLEEYATRLAARGYGLTLGIHTRLESFARRVQQCVPAGNVYINRSMTGAVVGVQPFGGLGLSGTGPKAGGPQALLRYAHEQSISRNIMAEGGDPQLLGL
ncbi:MAG: bifunctional proline dehydrogenase/L-glutamate gamma-semialdehyde dehydrogenase PutA [Novosphingobium sp.]|nr:bifunctional proline dehydrogenase/L-glutamate gamma-semialdehyde dehydrogenase PutA [Novosphingobium sp.]